MFQNGKKQNIKDARRPPGFGRESTNCFFNNKSIVFSNNEKVVLDDLEERQVNFWRQRKLFGCLRVGLFGLVREVITPNFFISVLSTKKISILFGI